MEDLSPATLTLLDELCLLLQSEGSVPREKLELLAQRWLADRPNDHAGLKMLLATLTSRYTEVTVGRDLAQGSPILGLGTPVLDSADDDGDAWGKLSTPAAAGGLATGSSTARPGQVLKQPGGSTAEEGGWRYPVFFATNRAPMEGADGITGFSARRSEVVTRGRCEVWLPKARAFGELGSPWWKRWPRLKFADDRVRLLATSALGLDEFRKQLRELVSGSAAPRQGLVFLHGYNTSFEDAALRAAQIGFDLEVTGATAFFSWPSQGNLKGYPADGAAVEASESAITSFLRSFAEDSGVDVVHIIAHSMGNRALLRAFQRLAADASLQSTPPFGQVILAAPDVDRDLFLDLAAVYPKLSARTTLYASKGDLPVKLSGWLHGYPRAGYLPPVTVAPHQRLDTIQVPDLDLDALGHNYFAGDGLLQDMFELMRHGTAPNNRQRIKLQNDAWTLLP